MDKPTLKGELIALLEKWKVDPAVICAFDDLEFLILALDESEAIGRPELVEWNTLVRDLRAAIALGPSRKFRP